MSLRTDIGDMAASIFNAPPHARKAGLFALAVFLPVWLGLSIAHLFATRGYIASPQWMMSTDGGYAELFQYALMILSASAFFFLFITRRELLFLLIACGLIYLFTDDAMMLHENAGAAYGAAGLSSFLPKVSAAQFGEFVYLFVVGAAILVTLYVAAQNAAAYARPAGFFVGVLILCLGLCSAVLDGLKEAVEISPFGYLEDSGEVFFAVLIAAYTVFFVAQRKSFPN